MASAAAEEAKAALIAERSKPRAELAQRRKEWDERALENDPPPSDTSIEQVSMGGVSCEWVTYPLSGSGGVFLLLHGGGYVSGSCVTHRKLAAHISRVTGMRVLVPNYRLAPEHPFPAGVQDALAAYGAMLAEVGQGQKIAVGGDSAGGGLTIALLLALRDAGVPMPACAVLLSPWTDILAEGESYDERRDVDPSIDPDDLRASGRDYTGASDPNHPLISPIKADLKSLPPLLIHVGDLETMLDDSVVFARRAEEAGVNVTLEIWPEMWHVWQQWVPHVPEAMEALDHIGRFVKKHR